MNQKEAESLILDLWDEQKNPWEKGDHRAFYNEAQRFYLYLETNHPDLLTFRCVGDKWQTVKGWINDHENYPHC